MCDGLSRRAFGLIVGLALLQVTATRGFAQDPPGDLKKKTTSGERPLSESEALGRIVSLEDSRRFVAESFLSLFSHPSARIRARAALAAGRIGDPRALDLVVPLLSDDVAVTTDAAFALGLLGDEAGRVPLIAALGLQSGSTSGVRSAVLEALGRLGGAESHAAILPFLFGEEHSVDVRSAAAIALARNPSPAIVPKLFEALADPHAEVRWRVAYALSRSSWKGDPGPVVRLLADEHPLVRLFAARSLKGRSSANVVDGLSKLAGDREWQVAVEAVRGLAAAGTPVAVRRLVEVSGHDVHHVRVEVMLGLRIVDLDRLDFPKDERVLAKACVIVGLRDASVPVAAEAYRTYGKVFRRYAMRRLPDAWDHPDPRLRSAAAEGLTSTDRLEIFPMLKTRLQDDPDPRVKEAILNAVSKINLPPARSILLAGLKMTDLAVLTTAADHLGARKEKRALEPILRALDRSGGRELAEARAALIRALSVVDSSQKGMQVIEAALSDSEVMVRLAAREALLSLNKDKADIPSAAELARLVPVPATPDVEAELWKEWKRNPRVRFKTNRGEFTVELFPLDAPLIVDGFLRRVDDEFYDGLTFHRVVPNWVVQGGDPRGDGWGGGGVLQRDQVTRRPYMRGSVGIPTSGKDTAGCQVFITLIPTPRLEGAYTQIGQVILGMEVVDRLEIDDRILKVDRK